MNQTVTIIPFNPTKADKQKGRWLLDSTDFKLPEGFVPVQSAIVNIAAGGWAANHYHKRQEVLLGLAGDLWVIWRDQDGQRLEQKMLRGDGQLQIFVITSNVPHLVENRSTTTDGALYEWSDLIDEATPLEDKDSLRA